MILSERMEKLLAWASAEPRKEALLAARRSYFERYGEPSEEDKSFESRMNGLLDFYVYDFHPKGDSRTTLDLFLEESGGTLSPEEATIYRDLRKNLHSLFEVRRLRPGEIRLRDVFTGGDHDVTERRQMVGLAKGDLLEARLLPNQGRLLFSGAFLYHPQEVRKLILAEVKRLKKEAGKERLPDVDAFLALLSRMAFKLERYRNVRIESIYDFASASTAATPRPMRIP